MSTINVEGVSAYGKAKELGFLMAKGDAKEINRLLTFYHTKP